MKTTAAVILSFFLSISVFSQNVDQAIISSAGGHVSNTFGQVSWTLGDLAISTATSAEGIVTQGFQQSLLDIGHGVQIIKSLGAGWTWFSLNLKDSDMSLETVLSNLSLIDGDYIKSQGLSSTYYSAIPGWFGSLTNLNIEETYKIKLGTAGVLLFEGQVPDPSLNPIAVADGWNWIGYIPQGAKPLGDALASLSLDDEDYIKSQFESSTYYAGSFNDWFGSLASMDPLEGFMLKLGNPGTITYPTAPMAPLSTSDDKKNEVAYSIQLAKFNPANFEHSGQVTAEIFLNGLYMGDRGDQLVTISEGILVGHSSAMVFPPTGLPVFSHLAFENSEENRELQFFFFDKSEDQWYKFDKTLDFQADMIEANAFTPFRLEKAAKVKDPLNPNLNASKSFKLYPNPVSSFANVDLNLDISQQVTLEILDVYGRIIRLEEMGLWSEGNNVKTIDLRTLANGVYFIRVKEAQNLITRFTKVK